MEKDSDYSPETETNDSHEPSLIGNLVRHIYQLKNAPYLDKEIIDNEYKNALRSYIESSRGINRVDIDDNEFFRRNPWNQLNDERSKSSFMKELTSTLLENMVDSSDLQDIKEASLFVYYALAIKDPLDISIDYFNGPECRQRLGSDIAKYHNSALLAIEEYFIGKKYQELIPEKDRSKIEKIARLYGCFMKYPHNGEILNEPVESPVIRDIFIKSGIATDSGYLRKEFRYQSL